MYRCSHYGRIDYDVRDRDAECIMHVGCTKTPFSIFGCMIPRFVHTQSKTGIFIAVLSIDTSGNLSTVVTDVRHSSLECTRCCTHLRLPNHPSSHRDTQQSRRKSSYRRRHVYNRPRTRMPAERLGRLRGTDHHSLYPQHAQACGSLGGCDTQSVQAEPCRS